MKMAWSNSRPVELTQVAALPLRIGEDGAVQVLLVTSRGAKRWVIPKGWTMKGRAPWEAASQEALEEAGVIGRPQKKPVGSYLYLKRRQARFDLCQVDVYLLVFARQLKTWREKGQRETKWFGLVEAATVVEETGLVAILQNFDSTGLGKMKLRKSHSNAA